MMDVCRKIIVFGRDFSGAWMGGIELGSGRKKCQNRIDSAILAKTNGAF